MRVVFEFPGGLILRCKGYAVYTALSNSTPRIWKQEKAAAAKWGKYEYFNH